MQFAPVTHILFDMDGLILNTEDLYTEGLQNVTSRYGKDCPFELKVKVMGKHYEESAKIVIAELDLPITVKELVDETMKQFELLFPNSKLMPGAQKLIEHLYKHNIPMALATSSSEEGYNLKTGRHQELFSLFSVKVFGSSDPDVKKGKPSPDIFLVAADRFPDKPNPEQCLVIEDSKLGVQAARAANMKVVMVPDPRLTDEHRKDATFVINSLEEFKPELFGLPPFDD